MTYTDEYPDYTASSGTDPAIFTPTPEALIERLAIMAAAEHDIARRSGDRTHVAIAANAVDLIIRVRIVPMLTGKASHPDGSGYLPPYDIELLRRFQVMYDVEVQRLYDAERFR